MTNRGHLGTDRSYSDPAGRQVEGLTRPQSEQGEMASRICLYMSLSPFRSTFGMLHPFPDHHQRLETLGSFAPDPCYIPESHRH